MNQVKFSGTVCLLNQISRTGMVVPEDLVVWQNVAKVSVFYAGRPAGVVFDMRIHEKRILATGLFTDPVVIARLIETGSVVIEPFVKVEKKWPDVRRRRTSVSRHVVTSLAVVGMPPWPGCTLSIA